MIKSYESWIFVNEDEIIRDKFTPITNMDFVKPNGGLWLAPYTKEGEYSSAWHDFLVNDMNRDVKGMKGTIVKIKNDAKILIIDNLDDLKNIFEKYELHTNSRMSYFRTLDFEKIAKDYDAILLTEEGQWKTRLSQPNLYGWDIECMLVMNFNIIEETLIITL